MSLKRKLFAGAVAVVTIAGGCGSSSTSSGGGSGKTYTIGIFTDESGLGASGNATTVQGVEAGIARAATQGLHLKYVVGDTETSPAGALTAAQKLVEVDHVSAIVAVSALTFAAAKYLTTQGVPVVGVAEDGPEWATSMNMFSVYGYVNEYQIFTTAGQLFKMEGGTTVGTLGYSISPSSSESAKATAAAAVAVGLKAPYIDAQFPFGSTNVGPIALAMKNDGVDSIYSATDPNTSFALLTALKQLGVDVKAAYFPTGYGGDITQGGPGAEQAAQGAIFSTVLWEPVAMNTPATQEFVANLKSVGVHNVPTESEYNGYASMAALVQAFTAAGSDPTHASLINALAGEHDFDGWGLMGRLSIDLNNRTQVTGGANGCGYFTKLVGSTFETIPGADPLCGTYLKTLPGG